MWRQRRNSYETPLQLNSGVRPKEKVMRFIVALLSTCVLLACSTAPAARNRPQIQEEPLNSAVEFLLTSAATDFHAHGPPAPVRFRDVRSGYIMTPDRGKQYRLCGSFSRAEESGKAEWTPFVTIQTSGYEQLLGAQAMNYCARSSVTWDKGDLSSSLQSRLESLR